LRVSRRAAELAGDAEKLARAVEELGPGESVVVVEARCLLVSVIGLEQGFAATVREAGRDELRRYLDYRYGEECVLLVNGSYLILGASSAVESTFGRLTGESRLSGILDSASMMSFQGAFEDEIRGAGTYPFTVRASDGSGGVLAQVVRLHRLPGADTLVRVHLYQPSVDLADFSPAEASFLDTVMRNVPMPAVRVNREGLVTRANDQALRLALETSAREPESTYFFDWVHPDERNKVISLHKRRTSGHYAPFKYRVRLQPASDITLQVEVTALQLPDETETLVFLNILEQAEGMRGATASHIQHIAGTAAELADSGDLASGLLDLMREAVSADGAAVISSGRVLTSGSAPVTPSMNGSMLASEMRWEETPDGLYNLVLPLKHPDGLVNTRFYGLHSNQPDPLARLFISLSPVLTDMIVTRTARRSVSSAMSGVLSFFRTLAGETDSLDELMEELADVCGADRALLSIVGGPEAVLSPVGGYGFPGALPSVTLHGDFTPGWAYTHQEVVYVPNMGLDERFSGVAAGMSSELAIPMSLQGRTVGTLLVASAKPSAFPNPMPGLLQVLATALALRVAADPAGRVRTEARSGQRGKTDKVEMEATLDELSRRIRSSLSTLRGYLELMSRGDLGPLGPDQTEAVEAMSRAMGGLSDYAGNLLTFLRLDLGPVSINPAWSHPSDLLTSLEPRLREKAARYRVDLELELPEERFTAFFDRARMEHIVLSLVDNAVRFNKPGGKATVALSRDEENWTLEVSDTGRGIPAGSLPYIYDRFYSEDPDGGGRSGLGIGLAVVKRFTEAMDGTISVWSREGKGTRVQVRLPVSG
jgi:signal transduction histidine kinase/PAS domain-containing protein